MSVILEKDVVFHCSVDAIIRPAEAENAKRQEKTTELWTMFKTYIKNGTKYEPRICAGMAPVLTIGDNLTLIGDLVDTGQYGIQFHFSGIQKQIPTERTGVINFLVKNVNGIGPVMAEKIVDRLGTDIVLKIRKDPSVLESINGISKVRAANIKEQLDGMESSLDELQFFAKTGLGSARVNAIKSTYAELAEKTKKSINVIELIKNNPYQLITDVKGIGFHVADKVALNIGFPSDDQRRIVAGLCFTLQEEVDTKGNIWIKSDALIKDTCAKSCLDLPSVKVLPVFEEMVASGLLINENEKIYLPYYYDLEFEIAKKMISIKKYQTVIPTEEQIQVGITNAEKLKERVLDDGQKNAVITCIKNNISIVTGGPGVGKTTTLDILLHFLENDCNMNITMVAPTGRAAKRMTEQTGRSASTIHMLSSQKTIDDFTIGNKRQALVVDESSMVDINMMKMLIELCHESTKLIFVGDVNQLPSIGPGQILRDMIESNVIATAWLTKIHRQSADSHIITNAHLCINGKHLEKEAYRDFFITEKDTDEECLSLLVKYVTKSYPKTLGVSPSDIQILAPLKSGALGVNNLNKVLQEALNPPSSDKPEIEITTNLNSMLFRQGDRVIQNKNDYRIPHLDEDDEGVYNGEIGVICRIINEYGEIKIFVEYPDKIAMYDLKSAKNLTLAYAISIHKSQGSEFKTVILPLLTYRMPMIYNRNLLYTAMTRAKQYLCIIGCRQTVNKMIHNSKVNKRRTTLASRLSAEAIEPNVTKKKSIKKDRGKE